MFTSPRRLTVDVRAPKSGMTSIINAWVGGITTTKSPLIYIGGNSVYEPFYIEHDGGIFTQVYFSSGAVAQGQLLCTYKYEHWAWVASRDQ